ncbi:unnamed protein product [Allacma fusca]|uniref:Uncharacterized protein n=1 Tax=Allacma fusca TaxID=39272 RepID=A0A8J2NK82_9HEXA|nr:unnamed protein product [Allacma fusca]
MLDFKKIPWETQCPPLQSSSQKNSRPFINSLKFLRHDVSLDCNNKKRDKEIHNLEVNFEDEEDSEEMEEDLSTTTIISEEIGKDEEDEMLTTTVEILTTTEEFSTTIDDFLIEEDSEEDSEEDLEEEISNKQIINGNRKL